MTRYDFAEISLPEEYKVEIACTETTDIENLITLLQTLNPKLSMDRRLTQSKETWNWLLKEFGAAKGSDIAWWIMKQLGLRGWEPLGAVSYYNNKSIVRYQFRRKMKGGHQSTVP